MIVLSIDNEESLLKYIEILKKENINYKEFVEPDLNNSITAVAICPSVNGKMFKDLKLLRI